MDLLEDRIVPSSFTEVEPNNTVAQANNIPIATGDVLTAGYDDWLNISGAISVSNDIDVFRFTLDQRSGVFFDIDSRETGLSTTLNSLVQVFNASGTTSFGSNDNGYDFDTGWPAPVLTLSSATADSSLYLELNAGTYLVVVASVSAASTGNYLLRVLADPDFSSSVPVFNSRPGSARTLYLDFNGHSATDAWGTYSMAAYDFNGNGAEWSPGEKLAIKNMWRVVAEDYSPFAINVTTSYSGPFTDTVGFRQVIANSSGSELGLGPPVLGIAFISSWRLGGSSNNTAFTFALNTSASGLTSGNVVSKPLVLGNNIAHEFGHALGLRHYETVGQNIAIMYTTQSLSRRTWFTGINDVGQTQNDMVTIASVANQIGYRPDDHGNTLATATVLTGSGGVYTASGLIERLSIVDFDYFRFTGAGATTITVSVDPYVNNLDVELRLFDAAGNLLATSDPSGSFSASLNVNLAAGTYYIEVRSDGDAGEAGQYDVFIQTTTNQPPVLNPISDLTIPSSQAVVTVPLSATDADGDPLTFSATAVSLAHFLDQQYDFFTTGDFYFNLYGAMEKWVQSSAIPSGWALILPNGELRAWDGSGSATGPLLGTVGTYYWDDPNRLINVPATPFASLSITGTTLTLTRSPTTTVSGIRVTVTVSDGQGGTDSWSFTITVTPATSMNQPPVLAPISDQTVPSSQATVTVPLMASDPDGDPLTFSVTAQSLAYVLFQQYGFSLYDPAFDNYGGLGEKWVLGGANWFYILPNGQLYQWTGGPTDPAIDTLLGNVGTSYYADPTRLINPPVNEPRATLSIAGTTLTITRDLAWISAMVVTVTVSDGQATASRMFTVFVTA
jgi:hypothetical protein